MSGIIVGDSEHELKNIEAETVDLIVTDPPYGYSFMGKDWDKAVPSVDIWKQCLRVLKPGAFAFIMSAPRMDVQTQMALRIQEAGFDVSFTPLYWAYASGFPKAQNMSKAVDKRLGAEREVIGEKRAGMGSGDTFGMLQDGRNGDINNATIERFITVPSTDSAKALNGSYGGFQPKPAVEVIIVAMKPLSERTYIDQALANGKGITWLDDGRIPSEQRINQPMATPQNSYGGYGATATATATDSRFPANLLVSDDVLDDGFSRYFSLDKWAETLPFLIVPKASKGEKNKGLDDFPITNANREAAVLDSALVNAAASRNSHPTVKPLKLMSYLISIGSRPGDIVLDPFAGSGTTLLAAKNLNREYLGIELNPEYAQIINARLGQPINDAYEPRTFVKHVNPQKTIFDFAG